jgi:flagellar hook-associated protein 2
VQKTDSGVTQVDSNYSGGVSDSVYTSLSGLGQLLSATSLLGNQLVSTTSDQANTISSSIAVSDPSVTATITDGTQATTASYLVNVTQIAAPQIQKSIYFASDTADYLGPGSFQIQTAQGSTNITATSGSLIDIASAINGANAGVSASITTDTVAGSQLVLTASQTGTSGNFVILAPQGDPFNVLATHFSQLGLAVSQTSKDATYTVNGGSVQTSGDNSGIQLDNAVTASLVSTGSSTVTVTATSAPAASYNQVLATASGLISQYNAFQSTFNQLLSAGQALNGNAAATNLQSQFSGLVSSGLAQGVGIGAGVAANTIQLNAVTLRASYDTNATDTINNLNTLVDSVRSLAQNTISGTGSGTINDSFNTMTYSIKSGITSTLSSATSPVPSWIVDYLTNHAVTSSSGLLPVEGFSTYV